MMQEVKRKQPCQRLLAISLVMTIGKAARAYQYKRHQRGLCCEILEAVPGF